MAWILMAAASIHSTAEASTTPANTTTMSATTALAIIEDAKTVVTNVTSVCSLPTTATKGYRPK